MKKIVLILIIFTAAVLRLYKIDTFPPSIYWDETSLGYNAYSILQTARDEHGKFLPLTNFAAFGDYKPPGYIYATVSSIAIFDLSEFAIRFPSAFFGILTVALTYFLAKELFRIEIVALFSTFFLAISPWHLQMSRAAFEANMALFFSVLGIYTFIKFIKKPVFIFVSALSFLIAMYTFTGQRLFVPLILIVLTVQFRKQILSQWKIVLVSVIISAVLFWPLFIFATQTIEGRLRFNEVSIFNDQSPIEESIKYRERNDFAWWSNIIHNRRVFYARDYLKHYFDAFNPTFLFISGDINPRLSTQEVGQLYYFDLILIFIGVFFLFSTKHKYRFLILAWLLVSAMGPATAKETPHALRMLHILPTYQLIAAYGLYQFIKLFKHKKLTLVISTITILILFANYLHFYYFHYSQEYSGQWQFGYKQAVEVVETLRDEVDNIYVTNFLGRPYIYFLLYSKYDPKMYWQNSEIITDQFFFINVKGFDKFKFGDLKDASISKGTNLFVTGSGSLPKGTQKLRTIIDLNQKAIFDIGIQE